jgi:hypothetical protein
MSDEEQQEQDEQQPEEFLNRAARRAAKHKKHAHGVAAAQSSDQPHGRGAALPARKSFGNRRSGG